jgi:hypothetical protein
MVVAQVELGVYIIAGSALVASIIGAAGAVVAALVGRENRRKLTTPGEGTGTIGQQVEEMKHDAT